MNVIESYLVVAHHSSRPEVLSDHPGYIGVGVGLRASPRYGGCGGGRRRRAAAGTDLSGLRSRGRGWQCALGLACSMGCGCRSALTKVFIMLLPASPLQYPLQPLSYRANTAYMTHSPGE